MLGMLYSAVILAKKKRFVVYYTPQVEIALWLNGGPVYCASLQFRAQCEWSYAKLV